MVWFRLVSDCAVWNTRNLWHDLPPGWCKHVGTALGCVCGRVVGIRLCGMPVPVLVYVDHAGLWQAMPTAGQGVLGPAPVGYMSSILWQVYSLSLWPVLLIVAYSPRT